MVASSGVRRRFGPNIKVLIITSLLVAASTAGTAQASTQPSASASASAPSAGADSAQAAYQAALKSPDWVRTPEGLENKSCVQTIPAGATFDQPTNSILLASGAKEKAAAPCAYPQLTPTGQVPVTGASSPAASFSYGWQAYSYWNSPNWLEGVNSTYTVPSAPSVGGTYDYFFSSLQGAGPSIVQVVLEWDQNQWNVLDEYNWNGGDKRSPTTIPVAPGDKILTTVLASNCQTNGNCTWSLDGTDERTGQSADLSINAGQPFTQADGGVMELPQQSGTSVACDQLPASGSMDFKAITIFGATGNPVTPSWSVTHNGNNKGWCGVYVDTSATETYIPW